VAERIASALALAALLGAFPARAMDRFEIQVYGADLNAPGEFGLELHLNFTPEGDRLPAYPGAAPLDHSGHYSLEASLGALEWLELGGYLLTFSTPDLGYQYGGWKARAKMVVPRRLTGEFFLGLNVEVGLVPPDVEAAAWSTEFRPILGWSNDWVYLSVNPIFGFALGGAGAFRVEWGPCAKADVNTQLGFGAGLEYYTSMGFLDALPAPSQWEQVLFAVVDLMPPRGGEEIPWELNLGVGKGLTSATPQQWVVKGIAGHSF
jgi:hypothetical protein